ncbi:MAG: restriction endonuclease [Lachnospiraceae bacterium]|nr:restriction endonuclease [Lachnospiraceae bacterium]
MIPEISILLIAAAVLVLCGLIFILCKKRKSRPGPLDEMEGHEFEEYCARLLRTKGFQEVRVTKGSRDFGLDILAEKDGVSYGIQCKHYASPVGVKAVQETYAGRDFYDCMVGVVMTNQYFTEPAVEAARKLKILLWDRGYLEEMLAELEDS